MWPIIVSVIVIVLSSLIHRYRGEGVKYFERWTLSILIAVGMYFFAIALDDGDETTDILNSVMTGIGMFIFLCQPWGRWFTIGYAKRSLGGPPSSYEKLIENIFASIKSPALSDMACWTLSAYIFTLPLIIVNGIWLVLPPLMILSYRLAWSLSTLNYAIRNAETISGALFAAIALITNYVSFSPAANAVTKIFG